MLGAPTHPRAPPEQLGGLPWPQELASCWPKVEEFPLSTLGWLWANVVDQLFVLQDQVTLLALGADSFVGLSAQARVAYTAIDASAVFIVSVILLGLRIAMAVAVKRARARAVLFFLSSGK